MVRTSSWSVQILLDSLLHSSVLSLWIHLYSWATNASHWGVHSRSIENTILHLIHIRSFLEKSFSSDFKSFGVISFPANPSLGRKWQTIKSLLRHFCLGVDHYIHCMEWLMVLPITASGNLWSQCVKVISEEASKFVWRYLPVIPGKKERNNFSLPLTGVNER